MSARPFTHTSSKSAGAFTRACLLGLLIMLPGCSDSLVIVNARVWTGDPELPSATALVVEAGRFVFVGTDDAARARASGSRVIDAEGARIIPGIIDAHLHLLGGGLQLSRLNLRDVADRAEFIAMIGERAKDTNSGEWILGGRWSTESWPDATQPDKSWIDPVTQEHPVLLSRMDGHGALANSVALRIAGIDASGPHDPVGGLIERDPVTKEPTGILKETAIELVSQHVPESSDRQLDVALAAAMDEANRHGITSVHTMSPWSFLSVFDRARRAGRLTLRIRQYVSEADWRDYIDRAGGHNGEEWVRVAGFKAYMDGSLGSRSAYMAEPYADNPPHKAAWCGILREVMAEEGMFQDMCNKADTADLAPAVHAIGDQANHIVLNAYAEMVGANGRRAGRRMRIEHAQHLLPGDISRFAELRVVASMQPFHKADDGRYAAGAIGRQRCESSYAFRGLLDAGAPVAFGSDWPVVTLNPFVGIHAAVTGLTLDGRLFVPQQSVSVEEALRAYTAGAAWAAGDQAELGQIKRGFAADFAILEDDLLAIQPSELDRVSVKQTFVGGRLVWPRR